MLFMATVAGSYHEYRMCGHGEIINAKERGGLRIGRKDRAEGTGGGDRWKDR